MRRVLGFRPVVVLGVLVLLLVFGVSWSSALSTPTLTTGLSAPVIELGAGGTAAAHDTASLNGATPTAGGTVTYKLYMDETCATPSIAPVVNETVTVMNGVVPDSSNVVFTASHDYYWQAAYSGDV